MIWDRHPTCTVEIILWILNVITYFVEYKESVDGIAGKWCFILSQGADDDLI